MQEDQANPLRELEADYPDWQFGTMWRSAASGPDYFNYSARRAGVLLTDCTIPGLRMKIRWEDEQLYGR